MLLRLIRRLFPRTIVVPEGVKERLRKPLGLLVRGSPEDIGAELFRILGELNPGQIITVGDVTSEMLLKLGLKPRVMVVDDRVERMRRPSPRPSGYKTLRVANPQGCISAEAAEALEKALGSNEETLVLVDGEEDLLALPALYLMSDNSVLLYGQPREGCVIVKGGPEIRRMVEEIIEEASRLT